MIINNDCLMALKELPENSVDAIITDPPYGLSFMGKKWDYDVPSTEIWAECLRVLKPGGYLLAFAGTRTQHRMAVRIEDAGFEIRDMIAWIYGQGFPKSTNIFKQLQKNCTCGNMEAYEKETIQGEQSSESHLRPMPETDISETVNSQNKQGEVLQSELSEQSSHETMLREESKESSIRGEEWVLEGGNNTQKTEGELQGSDLSEMPEGVSTNGEERRIHNATQISDGSTSETIIDENRSNTSHRPQPEQQQDREPCAFCKQWGTQALGAFGYGSALKPSLEPITVARKPISEKSLALNFLKWGVGGINIDGSRVGYESNDLKEAQKKRDSFKNSKDGYQDEFVGGKADDFKNELNTTGRFPANLIHDGSDEVVGLFPETKTNGVKTPFVGDPSSKINIGGGNVKPYETNSGSAARFFYCAKASKSERNRGCEGLEDKKPHTTYAGDAWSLEHLGNTPANYRENVKNNHPTVKPIALMEYLVKLVSKEGHTVLDPFLGSGTTAIACKNLNRNCIGIERDAEYVKISEARISAVK